MTVATHGTIIPLLSLFGRLRHLCGIMLWRPLVTTIKPAVKSEQILYRREIEPRKRFCGPRDLRSKPWYGYQVITQTEQRFVTEKYSKVSLRASTSGLSKVGIVGKRVRRPRVGAPVSRLVPHTHTYTNTNTNTHISSCFVGAAVWGWRWD